jgi:purine-binding chemotaxis protein CheW
MTATLTKNYRAAADKLDVAAFYVGQTLMGIPIDQVEEINHQLDLTPVPQTPPQVRGVVNLRGEVVTVIDLRVVLGLEPTVLAKQTCNVLVRSQGEQVGLLADRVADVIRTRRSDIERPPANVGGTSGRFFQGVCKLKEGLLVILDVEEVLAIPPPAR